MSLRLIHHGRVSTEDQNEYGTGMETQYIECLAYAKRIGATVICSEDDPGVSGTIYPRPGLEQALRRIEAGEANGLIVHRVDRVGRKAWIPLVVFERLQATGARLLTVQDGEITQENILFFSIRCGMAQADHQQLVGNMKAGKRRIAEKGLAPHRSTPPYGYHIIQRIEDGRVQEDAGAYRIVEEQARIVLQIFTLYASGVSLQGIINILHAQGTPTPRPPTKKEKAEWSRPTIKRILSNPAYKGTAIWFRSETKYKEKSRMTAVERSNLRSEKGRYRKSVPTPEEQHVVIQTPPIVPVELWERCQERRVTNKQNTYRNDRKYLLSGLLFCPKCGLRMIVVLGRPGYIAYRCRPTYPLNESGRAGKAVRCDDHGFPETQVWTALIRALQEIASNHDFARLAYSTYLGEEGSVSIAEQIAASQKKLGELQEREKATAKAYVNTIQTGTPGQIFEEMLREISEERGRIEKEIAMLALASVQRRAIGSQDMGALAMQYAGELLEVVKAEELADAVKNDFLRQFVKSITPTEEGYEIVMRPFTEGSEGVLVTVVGMTVTSKTIRCWFQGA